MNSCHGTGSPSSRRSQWPRSCGLLASLTHNGNPKHSDHKVPTPFIDRLTVTVKVPTKSDGFEMFKAMHLAFADSKVFHHAKHSKGYKWARRIALDSVVASAKWPFYEIDYEDKCVTRLRIDFVPVDLGLTGMQDLNLELTTLMNNGWGYIATHGRISRLDVAVDFPDVEMDQFHFLPKKGATTKQWSSDGKLQTYQHGKAKSSHTSIYNRKAKRIAQGKPWAGKQGIRVERRLINPGIAVTALPELLCAFSGIDMVQRHIGPPITEQKPYIWHLFQNASEHMGMEAALGLLRVDKRKAYRKHLKANLVDWWDEDAIWAGWPKMLSDLKIANPYAW
jgi:hypothetical protein